MKNFITSGKKGDLIMLLYIVKAMGGGNIYITEGEFEEPLESVIGTMSRLVMSQDYVHHFGIHNGEPIDVDLDKWRGSMHLFRTTLLDVMCRGSGLELPYQVDAWIDVPPNEKFSSKIIIHRRSSVVRNRANPLFDWDRVLDTFGVKNFVFVSRLKEEWRAFGYPEVAYHYPDDIYEHARAIKGCRFFIGNQSSPSALADALGVNRIFEASCGMERRHFAVDYSKNAWYFASPWDCTIKNFRYLAIGVNGSYLDLATNSKARDMDPYKFDIKKAVINEFKFRWDYHRAIVKRFVKSIMGRI